MTAKMKERENVSKKTGRTPPQTWGEAMEVPEMVLVAVLPPILKSDSIVNSSLKKKRKKPSSSDVRSRSEDIDALTPVPVKIFFKKKPIPRKTNEK